MTNTGIASGTIGRDTIIQALEIANIYEYEIREDYSGRGMYGDTCFGIVFDTFGSPMGVVAKFAAALGVMVGEGIEGDDYDDGEALFEMLGRMSTDSMGMGTIVYFPGVELQD